MHCYVVGCKNTNKSKGKKLTFHRFPKHLGQEWLLASGRDKQKVSSDLSYYRICSDHFTVDDFDPNVGLVKRLKPGAIPTRNVPIIIQINEKLSSSEPGTSDLNLSNVCTDTVHHSGNSDVEHSTASSSSSLGSEVKEAIGDENVVTVPQSTEREFNSLLTETTSGSHITEKIKKTIETMHNYGLSPQDYSKDIEADKERIQYYRNKLKGIQKTSSRRANKISRLILAVRHLEKMLSISLNAVSALENSFPGVSMALIRKILINNKRRKNNKTSVPLALVKKILDNNKKRKIRRTFVPLAQMRRILDNSKRRKTGGTS